MLEQPTINHLYRQWTREFQTWAPNVRAVPYYGEAASRDIIRNYEIFQSSATSGQTKLKLHVLITTYETFLTKHEWASVFKAPTRWETLVIDEGQRRKIHASVYLLLWLTVS
jgi:chromodomain-helicase-DNA-binding protein 4